MVARKFSQVPGASTGRIPAKVSANARAIVTAGLAKEVKRSSHPCRSEKLLRILFSELSKIRVEKCPFFNLPAGGRSRWDQGLTAAEMKRRHWVKPVNALSDKNANEVVREKAS